MFEILERYRDVFPLLPDVQSAADANRDSLGFMPASVYGEFAQQGNLFVIAERKCEQLHYSGHLLFARRVPRASVLQMFVLPKDRKNGLATKMLSRLKALLTSENYISIGARVAEDLNIANAFWEEEGFYVQRIEPGGITRARTILVRSHELPSPQLFPIAAFDSSNPLGLPVRASSDVPLFLLDLNVLFDFSPRRLRRDQAIAIIQAERMNFCRVAVSEEARKELARTAPQGRTDPMETFVSVFPTFPTAADGVADTLISEVAEMIFGPGPTNRLTANDLSDVRHVVTTIQNKLAGLITSDSTVLEAGHRIGERYSIQILSPEAFTLVIRDKPNLSQIESTKELQLSLAELRPSDSIQVRGLLSNLGLSGSAIAGGWLPSHSETRVVAHRGVWQNEALIGFITQPALNLMGALAVRIAVNEQHAGAGDAARALLVDFFDRQPRYKPQLIQLNLAPNQSVAREIANSYGFSGTPDRHVLMKVISAQIFTARNWNAARESLRTATNLRLPDRPPMHRHADQQIELLTADGNRRFFSLHSLEDLLTPMLLCLPGRPAVITPIRRDFAHRLLRHSRQGSLLPDDKCALFQERHYLSDSRTLKHFTRGNLILFYESLKSGGSGEIIAIGRVARSYLKAMDTLTPADLLQSVITLETLPAIGDSAIKTFTAFDNVFVLKYPVALKILQKLGCGTPNDLITTRPIDDPQLQAILDEALGDATA
jgi:GNAT superfamily N-acetyltransferase